MALSRTSLQMSPWANAEGRRGWPVRAPEAQGGLHRQPDVRREWGAPVHCGSSTNGSEGQTHDLKELEGKLRVATFTS